MQSFLPKSMRLRVYGAIGILCVTFIAIIAFCVFMLVNTMTYNKRVEIESVVSAAYTTIDSAYRDAQAGLITTEEAKVLAIKAVSAMRYQGDEYLFIFSDDYKGVAHPMKPELIGADTSNITDTNGVRFLKELVDTSIREGEAFISYNWLEDDGKEYLKFSYVKHFEPWGWAVGSGVKQIESYAAIKAVIVKPALIISPILLIILGLGIFAARWIGEAVHWLCACITKISTGDYNFDTKNAEREDELGEVGRSLVQFREDAQKQAQLEAEVRENFEKNVAREKSINELIALFRETSDVALKELNGMSETMRSNANDFSGFAQKASTGAQEAFNGAQRASASVQNVAAASEELSASIVEISRQVEGTVKVVGSTKNSANICHKNATELISLNDEISEFLQLIKSIAEKTKLLALNATIEAARAGQHGTGFAVVASEVKDLAEQTEKAAASLEEHVVTAADHTNNNATALEVIAKEVDQIVEFMTAVSTSVEQQQSATSEISLSSQESAQGSENVTTNIEHVTSSAQETSAIAEQMLLSADNIAASVEELQRKTEAFLSNVAEQQAA